MGLISKIEDKLSGSSSSDTNKSEKPAYGSVGSNTVGGPSSATSKLQNPISSSETSGPTGSAIDPATGNVHSSYAAHSSSSGGYSSTSGGTDRMPGSYVTDDSHIPTSTTSTSRTGPNQPYDPYSSKGQETAARAGTSSSTGRTMEDPSLSRSRDGGIMNQQSEQPYTSQTSQTSDTTSSHHYGRDAALAGGADAVGAGGIGAYEINRNKPPTEPLTSSIGQRGQTGQYQDASYMQQSQPGGAQDPSMAGMQQSYTGGAGPGISNMPGSTTSSGAVPGESPGLTQAKKMGGAYEAGYRDGMEHMRQEMLAKGAGSGQAI